MTIKSPLSGTIVEISSRRVDVSRTKNMMRMTVILTRPLTCINRERMFSRLEACFPRQRSKMLYSCHVPNMQFKQSSGLTAYVATICVLVTFMNHLPRHNISFTLHNKRSRVVQRACYTWEISSKLISKFSNANYTMYDSHHVDISTFN